MEDDTLRQVQSGELEALPAQDLCAWALRQFGLKVALASSFGVEDMVLLDMLARAGLPYRVVTLDTGRLPQETYELMDRARERYSVQIDVFFPDARAVEEMVRDHGVNLFYTSLDFRRLCCRVRKVEPLRRALAGLDAWITGLRREQAVTRTTIRKAALDPDHGGILKLSPLAEWTEAQVWAYARAHHVPVHALHAQGYPSIGCAPCTRAVKPGEDPRAGRWWWESPDHKECGLHPRGRAGERSPTAKPQN